jgi:hypothetical protein
VVIRDIDTVARMNIAAVLEARHMKPAELARLLRKSHSWLSRVLNPPLKVAERRSLRLADVERIARILGLLPHELLAPGIHPYTERRHQERRRLNRRSGEDRRTA